MKCPKCNSSHIHVADVIADRVEDIIILTNYYLCMDCEAEWEDTEEYEDEEA